MRYNFRTLPITLLIFFSTSVFAQTFSSRAYNEEKGLNGNFIFSITQNQNGVLELATEKGLTGFNGDKFSTISMANGLAEDQVSCAYAASNGITWVGHFQKGISCVSNGVVSIIDSSQRTSGRITSIAEDKAGNIWAAITGKGLARVDKNSRKVDFPGDTTGTYEIILFDSSDRLLAGSEKGIEIYQVDKNNKLSLLTTILETSGKKVDAACFGKMYGKEMLFVCLNGDGLYCFSKNDGRYTLQSVVKTELRCIDLNFSSVACTQTNDIWIGTIGEGLRKVSFGPAFFPSRTDAFREADGLPDDNIKSLLVDFENNLWLGTFGRGLVEIPFSVFRFYTNGNGLVKPEVNCITKDRSGAFWLGNNNGITKFRKDGSEKSLFFNKENGFVSAKVNCVATDPAGLIWIGTDGEGIFRLDPLTEKFENISRTFHLTSMIVNTITVPTDGRVMIGTTDGLYIYKTAENTFAYYTTMEGLLHNNIQQLYTDRENNVWFSSSGTPPYILKGEEIKPFFEIEKIKGYNINGVYEDNLRNSWIATDGDGIFEYNGKKFRQYTVANGLKSNNCIGVIADNNNVLYVIHKSGISLKFPGDTLFYVFSGYDNRLFDAINPFVYKDDDGIIYFSSANGIVEITSQDKSYLKDKPYISLARLFINGSELYPRNEIFLDPGTYILSFEFNNILFNAPYPPPFYYRIVGADSAWRMSSGRNIIIPQLSSGTYELQVSSDKNGKQVGKNFASVKIFIDKPFWQKTWFIVLALLFIPVAVLGLIRLQTISLVRLNKRLQTLVSEKTSLLNEEKEEVSRMNIELQSKNKDITDSIEYAKRIQMAILPDLSVLKEQFPESFVFYLPRDIVSGDFYWFAQKGPLFIIALVDCTGHGIPGAFMSMIGSTLLNKIVFDYDITEPAEILQYLNKDINLALHQQESSESSHDGMDIALCAIDKTENTLRFAGAGRPVVMMHNGELSEYKTNRGGIGGVYNNIFPVFEEIEIKLEKNDSIYLFSDGFTDQFSSGTNAKYSSKRMRALLKEISTLPMEEQGRRVEEAFFTWKGEEFQFDDVLFMGFTYT
jgi:ligand-binding sensor domain-containing protein/serine phosphatase RsbU (regulator of sigma subunit)